MPPSHSLAGRIALVTGGASGLGQFARPASGFALWHRSAFSLGLAAAVFLVVHLIVVYGEEPGLEKRFGYSYREYRRNVRRWLPRTLAGRPVLGARLAEQRLVIRFGERPAAVAGKGR